MSLALILAVFVVVAIIVVSVNATFQDHRDRSLLSQSVAEGMQPLLHSINLDRCIGCEGCVDACPTKVLDLNAEHKVRVVNFKDCVQCEQCAWACPTTALVMYREGTEPQKLTVPELDPHFQTSVPGQYLIGEVAGKPLVKNAANIGRLVVEHMLRTGLEPSGSTAGQILDVAIVGSGPGGLSAALACMKHGLSSVVLEKEQIIASTVSRYPKGKSFMSEPADSRNLSFLPVFDASKEELLASWEALLADVKLPINKGEAVESVKRGDDGIFEVRTTVASYRARRVVLATGLRGKPRLLAVPGANLPKVSSILEDADSFAGQHVLVVGGGDSALEAAMSLSDAGCTSTTLSYRSGNFKRAKPANQKRVQEYADAGKIRILMESNATAFDEGTVTIKLANGESEQLPNQQAFLLIGADAPIGWLEKLGVCFVERPHTYALGASDSLLLELVQGIDDCPADPVQAAARIRGQAFAPASRSVQARPHKPAPKPRRARSVIEAISSEWTKVRTAVHGVVDHLTPAPSFVDDAINPFAETQRATARMVAIPSSQPALSKPRASAPQRKKAVSSAPPPIPAAAMRTKVGGPTSTRSPSQRFKAEDGKAPLALGTADFSEAEVGSAIDAFFDKTDVTVKPSRQVAKPVARLARPAPTPARPAQRPTQRPTQRPAQRPAQRSAARPAPLPPPSSFSDEEFEDADLTSVDPPILFRSSSLR